MAEAGQSLGWCSRCPMWNGIAIADGTGRWVCDRCGRSGVDPTHDASVVHWVGDAPTSMHGNGAGSFERETRDVAEVTCKLCLTLITRGEHLPASDSTEPVQGSEKLPGNSSTEQERER